MKSIRHSKNDLFSLKFFRNIRTDKCCWSFGGFQINLELQTHSELQWKDFTGKNAQYKLPVFCNSGKKTNYTIMINEREVKYLKFDKKTFNVFRLTRVILNHRFHPLICITRDFVKEVLICLSCLCNNGLIRLPLFSLLSYSQSDIVHLCRQTLTHCSNVSFGADQQLR